MHPPPSGASFSLFFYWPIDGRYRKGIQYIVTQETIIVTLLHEQLLKDVLLKKMCYILPVSSSEIF